MDVDNGIDVQNHNSANLRKVLTSAERKKRYTDKLKATGLFEAYKRKNADHERQRRESKRYGLKKSTRYITKRTIKYERGFCAKKVAYIRNMKNLLSSSPQNNISWNDVYNTRNTFLGAVRKTERSLPQSLKKQILIVSELFTLYTNNNHVQIGHQIPRIAGRNTLKCDIVEKVQQFYERDDISRMSPNVKDAKKILNKNTGKKEVKQTRHMLMRLSEAYALFVADMTMNDGTRDARGLSNPPLKMSKFAALRPTHVKLVNKMRHNVTLFTIALKYSNKLHAKVFVSDNNDHSKYTIVAYLYKNFCELPKTIKFVKIWSDGPSTQFKNKYIVSVVELFKSLFPIRIIWNYFATSHGKGCVDGFGAVAKYKVKRLVITRKAVVNNAKEFVAAFSMEDSLIDVIEMSNSEIEEINRYLELDYVFETAKAVPQITSFHQLQVVDDKVKGF